MVKTLRQIYRKIVPAFIRKRFYEVRNKRKLISVAIANEMEFQVNPSQFWYDFNTGIWEPATKNFYKRYISPMKAVVDIGGWIGPTMLIAYSHNPSKIYVVEADPVNYQILKSNCMKNYLEDKVELYHVCIADKTNDVAGFGYADRNIHDTSTKTIVKDGERVKVRTITLDDYLKKIDMGNVNVIKIDIEGGEQYIESGLEYIAKFPEITILFSIHTPFWNDKEKTTQMLLEQFKHFDVFSDTEEKINEEELYLKLMSEKPTQYNNKTGEFFTVILKTKS